MTEQELRAKVVSIAQSYLGCKESNGSHKKIIDLYNSHKPLARGYKVKYTDAWCSTFASAVAIAAGLTDIIPTECGCEKHIQLFKAMGIWEENDAHVPSPGDYVFYDWDDNGKGDCTGAADHVGIVEKVSGRSITVIEGNMSNAVGRRTLKVNGRYIRGYGIPQYASKATGATAAATSQRYTVGKTNEKTIFNFCREVLGLNVAGAVGVITNVASESGFKTGAIGDRGTSFGICQWHAGRYTNLKAWCGKNGKDYVSLDGQLWFMKHELETSYASVLAYLKGVPNTADGAYNAAYRWCLKFEVPANTVATSEKRGNIARGTYWPKYGGTGTTTTASTLDGAVYVVVKGDTLSKIASRNKTTVASLVALNGIKNANVISVGQVIFLTEAAAAIGKLAKLGVINSPDYWQRAVISAKVKYLDLLFVQAATKITKAKPRTTTVQKGVEALVSAGVMTSPDYWTEQANKKTEPSLGALLCALGGAVQ